jgi:RNA polymerase sigma factor (sigma-70 family)
MDHIRRGAGRHKISTYFSPAEEREAIGRYQTGDSAALRKIIEAHEPELQKWANRYNSKGLDLDDKLQLATEGLIEAAKRFDLDRPNGFSAYARHWIHKKLSTDAVRFSSVTSPARWGEADDFSADTPVVTADGEDTSETWIDQQADDDCSEGLIFSEERNAVIRALDRIDAGDRDRKIFSAHLNGATFAQLGRRYGISAEAARLRFLRTRDQIKTEIDRASDFASAMTAHVFTYKIATAILPGNRISRSFILEFREPQALRRIKPLTADKNRKRLNLEAIITMTKAAMSATAGRRCCRKIKRQARRKVEAVAEASL